MLIQQSLNIQGANTFCKKKRKNLKDYTKMTKPKIMSVLNLGLICGAIVSALSFFFKIVPCRFSTLGAAGFGFCKLPSIFSDISDLSNNYYGVSNNPLAGLVFQFIITLIILSIILFLFKKRNKKILDLTNKMKNSI